MPAPKRGPRLGAGPKHQKLILAQQASELFRHGRIKTTVTKAKTLRPYAERLITKAKQGDLHSRRQVLSKLRDRDVVAYLFEDVAPRFADRNGGYTRLLKLGPRPGDNAPMAMLELVELGEVTGEEVIEESRERRSRGLFGRRRKKKAAAPAQDGDFELLDDDYEGEDEEDETSESTSESTSDEAVGSDAPDPTDDDIADELTATDAEPADTPDADEDEGLEAQAPEGPAQEPSAPDDPAAGNPVGPADTPDAGKGTGKDAGKS